MIAEKGKEELKDDTWVSPSPNNDKNVDKPTEPSTVGSPDKAQQQSLKLNMIADSSMS